MAAFTRRAGLPSAGKSAGVCAARSAEVAAGWPGPGLLQFRHP
jgi:hypothetical protein